MFRLVIICSFCLVGILGCKTDEERCLSSGGKVLNAVEAKAVYRGNTMTGEIPSQNMQFQVHYASDGAMSGRVTLAGATDTDKGAYAISGNGMLCTRWTKWHVYNGCIAVYQEGNTYKMFNQATGEILITQKMLKGDPMNLSGLPTPATPQVPTPPVTTPIPAKPPEPEKSATPPAPVKSAKPPAKTP